MQNTEATKERTETQAVVKPRLHIFDSAFQYTPSHATDISKTFAKIRAQEKAKQPSAVVPIKRKEAR